jgi:hypothetical protein
MKDDLDGSAAQNAVGFLPVFGLWLPHKLFVKQSLFLLLLLLL